MIWKALLTRKWLRGPLHFAFPSTDSTQHWFWEFKRQNLIKNEYLRKPTVNMAKAKLKSWCLIFISITYTQCYICSDENGIESAVGSTGEDIPRQIKWLGGYTNMHIGYILISWKLWYVANFWSKTCWIKWLILYLTCLSSQLNTVFSYSKFSHWIIRF